ncbi:MAG: glycosyltransferase family 2 protein [Candidatus Bathyarchaeia archaeon]
MASTKKDKPFIIACIPAYNEEATIAKVIIQAQKHVDKVIVCDDGSKDYTGLIAEKLGAEVIKHERRLGKGAALRSLFKRAEELKADAIVTLDADGQHNPDDIPELLRPILNSETDVVVGSRYIGEEPVSEGMPKQRKIGIKAIDGFVKKLGKLQVKDTQSGFRAYSLKALKAIMPVEMDMSVDSEILMRAVEKGLRIIEVPVKVSYLTPKPSKHTPLYHALQVFLGALKFASIRHPLLFYGTPGLIFLAVSIFCGFMAIKLYLDKDYFSVPFTLLAAIFAISGLILLFTAIILFTVISILREDLRH